MNTTRSPMGLRPRKSIIKTQDKIISKNQTAKLQEDKSTKKNLNDIKSKSDSKSNENSMNDELTKLRQTIENQQKITNDSISKLYQDTDERFNKFNSIIESIKNDVDQIKTEMANEKVSSQIMNNNTRNFNTERTLSYLLQGSGLKQMETCYKMQINEITSRIEAIETNNTIISEALSKIINITESIEKRKETQNNCNDIHEKFENAIQCHQVEIDKLILYSHTDIEKLRLMNHQIHVLSSKYIEFNKKINNYLIDFNRNKIEQNIGKISNNIIDKDTLPYMNRVETQKQVKVTNILSSIKLENNRFGQKQNTFNYIRFIKVNIKNAVIHDLNNVTNEFSKIFEHHIGKGTVKNAIINKYHCQQAIIDQIQIVVSLNIPLTYDYIDAFKFPSNWSFSEYGKTYKQSKNPMQNQHSNNRQVRI